MSLASRLTITRAAALAAALAAATGGAAAQDAPRADSMVLFYVGHAIGQERWALRDSAGGRVLTSEFDYRDRGRRTHTGSVLRMARDWAPQLLEIRRLGDTSGTVTTRVEVRGHEATVVARGDTTRVALPALAFPIAGTTPTAQHLALVHYWLAHGRPATLAVVPGMPTNVVRIARRGRDTLQAGGRRVALDRYTVDGVVWGSESVWLDEAGGLAAFMTAGGGGLTMASVRHDLAPRYDALLAASTRDHLAELAARSRAVRPVASAADESSVVALVGATLVDGSGRDAVPDAVVVVRGGRVVAAGPGASVAIPSGARRVDVRGKTIVPGLWDMHAHVMQAEWPPVYLAAGVTTVRDMGNEIGFIVPLRDALRAGTVVGPRLVLAGLVDGPGIDAFGALSAATPEEGRAIVRRYHALGFEQMKLYSVLAPDVVGAITREAHALGMTVTGHIPTSLTLLAAIDSGMDQVAHLPIRGEAGSDTVRHIIEVMKARGTVVDPTASWGEILGHSLAEPVASFQPGVSHLPPVLWQRIGAMGAAVDTAAAHARVARTLRIIRALHDAGVPVVAGTDEGVPAFSVYREIELYAAAGFTPMEALRAATAVPARAMRLDAELGTVEPGKRADLLVLDRNPLDAIANIRSVRLVMHDGVLYDSAELWGKATDFR